MTSPIPDISNYTPNFTLTEAINWRDNLGIKKVIIQAVDPPPGYPSGKTREQIQVAITAGLKIGIYYFHWFEDNPNGLENRITLIAGFEDQIDDHILDVEDIQTGISWSQSDKESSINAALTRLDELPSSVGKTRMYSGKWYMDSRLPGSDYSDREWWVAQYDGIKDASVITGWDGIGSIILKQYAGTSTFGGRPEYTPKTRLRDFTPIELQAVLRGYYGHKTIEGMAAARQARRGHFRYGTVSGIDLSVPTVQEELRIVGQPTDPCQEVEKEANGLVSSLGWLGKDAMTKSGILKSTSRYVRAYLDMVRSECEAHGIQHD